LSSDTLPQLAPVSEHRLCELRRAMGADTWDRLFDLMPEAFIRAYDAAVETLYGRCMGQRRYNRGTARHNATVVNGGWLLHDSRALPIKAHADAKCKKIIRQMGRDRRYTKATHTKRSRIELDLLRLADTINRRMVDSGIAPLIRKAPPDPVDPPE
jgi:hypothetical protein